MRPIFSIITVCRNPGGKFATTMQSVLAQQARLFEFVVVDGASTDGTVSWLHARKEPSLIWISEPDQGVYDAMNKSLKLARGQFLYFLGAGDRLVPGVLEEAAQFVTELPDRKPRFIYGNVRMLAEGGRISDGAFSCRRICTKNICHQAIFYERSIFELAGGYDLKYPIFADWAYNLKCFGDRRISKHYWDEVIADFDGGGLSARIHDVAFSNDLLRLIRKHLGPLAAAEFWLRHQFRRRLAWSSRV